MLQKFGSAVLSAAIFLPAFLAAAPAAAQRIYRPVRTAPDSTTIRWCPLGEDCVTPTLPEGEEAEPPCPEEESSEGEEDGQE